MTSSRLTSVAADLRAKAKAATPGPWVVPGPDDEYVGPADVVDGGEPGDRYVICEHAGMDAAYIAAMHPAVALALADWLDGLVEQMAVDRTGRFWSEREYAAALALCDAYEGSVDMRAKGES